MKILHMDSSILMGNSVSRALSGAVVDRIRSQHPDAEVDRLDLVADEIPHLQASGLAGLSAGAKEDGGDGSAGDYIDQLLSADVVVMGVAMYNWSIPSQLKAWMDRIVVAGRTFRYSEHGAVGLAGGRRLVIAISRGGNYTENSPIRFLEHAETYLVGVFNVLGITEIDIVAADGVGVSPEAREQAVKSAMTSIQELSFVN